MPVCIITFAENWNCELSGNTSSESEGAIPFLSGNARLQVTAAGELQEKQRLVAFNSVPPHPGHQ